MTTKGVFISRVEIKNELQRNLATQNIWQARYCKAVSNENAEREAKISKARVIRSGHRVQAIMDFLSISCNVEMTLEYDFDSNVIEGFHPITAVRITWGPGETETLEIKH